MKEKEFHETLTGGITAIQFQTQFDKYNYDQVIFSIYLVRNNLKNSHSARSHAKQHLLLSQNMVFT